MIKLRIQDGAGCMLELIWKVSRHMMTRKPPGHGKRGMDRKDMQKIKINSSKNVSL